MNDWICPYCHKILYGGGNKLRHLAKHEPIIRRLIRSDFIKGLMLMEVKNEKLEE